MQVLLHFSLLLFGGTLLAQRSAAGQIFNEWADPVAGVEVRLPGSDRSVQTDENGFYRIDLPYSADSLSFVGDTSFYWSIERMAIPGEGPFNVMLINKVREQTKNREKSTLLKDSLRIIGRMIDRGETCPGWKWENSHFNEPLIGAGIIAYSKDEVFGTISDLDGRVALTVPPGIALLEIGDDGMEYKRPILPDVGILYLEVPLQYAGTCAKSGKQKGKKKGTHKKKRKKANNQ